MSRFLRVLITITAIAHVSVFCAAIWIADAIGFAQPNLVGAAVVGAGTFLFLARARAGMHDSHRHPLIVRFVDVPYFVHWCAALFAMIPTLLGAIVWPVVLLARGEPAAFPTHFAAIAYAAGLVICAYGILYRRRVFLVDRIDVPIDELPKALDGLTIAHLSDLHIGALTPKSWGKRWVEAANRAQPDLAVVTGDMVTSGTEFHSDIAEVIGGLRALHGTYVCMGNHDYFGDGEPLISLMREAKIEVLRNEGVALTHEGETLFLAGIDDTWTRRDDLGKALAARPAGAPTILLAHDPERFPRAVAENIALVLSGHTHGGQIAVPFLATRFSLAHFAHRYRLGLYREKKSTLYVHPGLGTTGPPIRLGVAPRVVLLRLRAR